ncbi:hypothetical protein [Myroides profundi]|uniref:Lipocalin-like domain-containing protein n=1 Tax=Myroides profundi TaxID=480520 RepID=A0AAJ4W416_MYRPR|nr:hypothetical protein [Myroides profundi]AJH14572.1 hypothetical protein MPR_1390 [Myroides profundi]SEQ92046.1 hypothetical protein SAMN04488089_107116 [Myroides profundi]
MKKFVAFSVALLSILTITILQGCSSSDDNNTLNEPQTLTATHNNIERKWLTTYYTFTPDINKAVKTAYQVSSVEITLKNGEYTLFDRYSEKSDKGTYTLNGSSLTLKSSIVDENINFKINKLTQNEIDLTVINHKHLTSVELIAIK